MRIEIEPHPEHPREAQVRCGKRVLGVFPYTVGDAPNAAFESAQAFASAVATGVDLAGGSCKVYRGPWLLTSVSNP